MRMLFPIKGVDEYAVQVLAHHVDQSGHTKLIFKSDNEPAILALNEAVRRIVKAEAIPDESPPYDSQGNEVIENAIKTLEGQPRTIKSQLESNMGFILSLTTCVYRTCSSMLLR